MDVYQNFYSLNRITFFILLKLHLYGFYLFMPTAKSTKFNSLQITMTKRLLASETSVWMTKKKQQTLRFILLNIIRICFTEEQCNCFRVPRCNHRTNFVRFYYMACYFVVKTSYSFRSFFSVKFWWAVLNFVKHFGYLLTL